MDRFFIDKIENGLMYIINKDEITHITKTLRMKENDTIEVMDGKGFVAIGKINSLSKSEIILTEEEQILNTRELNTYIKVYQGIPKGQKMELIVQKLTEIGVSEIVPVNFERCIKKIKDKEERQIERWQRIAFEATKQCKRSIVPLL